MDSMNLHYLLNYIFEYHEEWHEVQFVPITKSDDLSNPNKSEKNNSSIICQRLFIFIHKRGVK